jgi:hypothetical protein
MRIVGSTAPKSNGPQFDTQALMRGSNAAARPNNTKPLSG